MAIFRLAMSRNKTGKNILGYKLVDGKSIKDVMSKPKSKYVGKGVFIVGIERTQLKGTTKSRRKLPRSIRFGKGYR